mmetsp:Transcript_14255/g.35378  ORF Transcript_14255/g.35378 Transcript_14255/m.35378 type:complete len:407 (+) Transcript_14255:1810-3030(+)
MVDGVQDHFLQRALGFFEPANVIPFHVGYFDDGFAQRTRVAHPHCGVEVVLRDGHGVQNFCVDGFFLEVDEVHFLPDARERRLGTQLRQVRADETVRVPGNLLELHVGTQLHILRVNPQNLQSPVVVRNTNVELAVESPEAAQRRVDGVGSVCGPDDHHLPAALQTIHQRQQLRYHSLFHFAVGFVSFGRDAVEFVDEDDGWRVFFGFLERTAQVALRLPGHLAHHFRTVDEEEKSPSLVRHRLRDQGFSRARRTIQQHSPRWLHAKRFEQRRMPEGELDHLANLRHLLLTATNVIIPSVVQPLLVFALHWLALAVNHCIRRDDAELARLDAHHLEFHGAKPAADQKQIALPHRAVRLQEIRLQVGFKQVSGDAFDGVVQREDVHALPVRHIAAGVDAHDVAQANP